MSWLQSWFQIGAIPLDAIHGTYSYGLVALSYAIAVFASYAALDLAGRLRAEKLSQTKMYWLVGGAIAMGAGIWSMHFIGMLAFSMPMGAYYDVKWTGASMIAAMLASAFALYLLRDEKRSVGYLVSGGVLLGLGICTMHYMGMQAMTTHVKLHYLPGLFFLSVVIAIFASEAALWLMIKSNKGSLRKQLQLKIMSALVMGLAICGMHYTGMAATVFTPLAHMNMNVPSVPPHVLAFYVAAVATLIIASALILSTYKQLMVSVVQTEKDFLNAILDNLEDSIVACDAKGKVTVFNNTIKKELNVGIDANFQKEWQEKFIFFDADHKIPIAFEQTPLMRALRGERISQAKYTVIIDNKHVKNLIVDGQPIKNAENVAIGAVIVIHDITNRLKMEKQLFESEKMAAVGQLATGIAHELNQPLTIIRANMQTMELLSNNTLSLEDLKQMVASCVGQVDRAAEMIARMRSLALELQINSNKSINLVDSVNMVIKKFKEQNKNNEIEVEFNFSNDLPNMMIDTQKFESMVANLLSNAKYAVEERNKKRQDQYKMQITSNLDFNNNNKKIVFEIADNGIGMTPEVLNHCLEPFYTAREVGQGAGLGLAICYNFVNSLKGELEIKSEPGRGTTVTIVLPVEG